MRRTLLGLTTWPLTLGSLASVSSTLTFLVVLVVTAVEVDPARADAVDPPPSSCPAGSTPSSSHSGPLCSPTADCTPTTTCNEGASCETVSQCVEQRSCGGRLPPDSGPCFLDHVVGPCAADGSCSTGTCRTRSVCATTAEVSSGGCGCAAVGAPPSAAPLALAAVLGALLVARRRR